VQVKIAIFHNLNAGSALLPSASPLSRYQDPNRARDFMPGDPMARVFEGYIVLTGRFCIEVFQQEADPAGQSAEQAVLDRAGIDVILRWVAAMTQIQVRALLGAQRDAGNAYHGRRLRPLDRGDVVAVGEAAFVCTGSAAWEPLTSPFAEVRQQAGRPSP